MTKLIALTQGYFALVDDADFDLAQQFKWSAGLHRSGKWYAQRTATVKGKPKTIYLHRQLMGEPDGKEVDHTNGDTLDDRRENLRPATHKQNQQNRRGATATCQSGYRGVALYRGHSGKGTKWQARAKVDGRTKSFGYFDTPEEAAVAAEAGRRAIWG